MYEYLLVGVCVCVYVWWNGHFLPTLWLHIFYKYDDCWSCILSRLTDVVALTTLEFSIKRQNSPISQGAHIQKLLVV